MGYYLQVASKTGKAITLVTGHDAQVINNVTPETWDQLPPDKSLVCVVENGPFDAAGWAFNKREVAAFLRPDTGIQRPRVWLVMDRQTVLALIGQPSMMIDPDWK